MKKKNHEMSWITKFFKATFNFLIYQTIFGGQQLIYATADRNNDTLLAVELIWLFLVHCYSLNVIFRVVRLF